MTYHIYFKGYIKLKVIILLICFFVSSAAPQLVTSSEHLQFPETVAGMSDSLSLTISNNSGVDLTVSAFRHYSPRFTFSDSLFTLAPVGEITLWIYYSPVQNVIDNDLLIYETASGEALSVTLSGSGKYNDNYQNTTFNLYDNSLKSALLNLVNNQTVLGYNLARDKMYMEIDNKRVNGQGAPVNTLECVYTGREAVGYIDRIDCQNNYGFNTEHTWPQSYFGSVDPMVSDLNHLYPTDATANNIRGNLHFGRVVSNIEWQVGGSKKGKDSLFETVFEPRDVHKGNIARSLFYFTVRYTNMGNFLDQKQEDLFRIWNYSDPADTIERKRNSDVALYQLKRNPFIDHPEFIDRIYSFRTNQERPKYALMELLPDELLFDSTDTGDTSSVFFYLLNEGNDVLSVTSILTGEPFAINNFPLQVDAYSYEKISVSFIPEAAGWYNSSVIVTSSTGTDTVLVTVMAPGISLLQRMKKSTRRNLICVRIIPIRLIHLQQLCTVSRTLRSLP